MSKIVFTEKEHKYKNRKTNKLYQSVTSIISKYEPKMDVEYWSKYKAYEALLPNFDALKTAVNGPRDSRLFEICARYIDDIDMLEKQNQIKKEWKDNNKAAISKGNKYHTAREKRSLSVGVEINPFTGKEFTVFVRKSVKNADNYSLSEDLSVLEDGYYPELLIWNDKYKIAGQSDRVFIETIDGVRYVDIDDYKTNSKITTSNKFQTLLPPLNHLPDSKFHKYSLQVSMYGWMMEQFGFKVRNTSFHHFNQMYKTEYMKSDIEKILKEMNEKKKILVK
jgi:hypothetical protein